MRQLIPCLVLFGCKGAPGEIGADGEPGVACWDLDANGSGDSNEDANADGSVDVRDCGADDGTSCWDLDGDGVEDVEEDVNVDGAWDALDCTGDDGLACWDLDGDGVADAEEDVTGDGAWTWEDCAGDAKGTILGVVVDANNGALVEGALVVLQTGDSTVTDVAGTFLFEEIPFGAYSLVASAPSLEIEDQLVVEGSDATSDEDYLSLLAGETLEVIVKLERLDLETINLTALHTGSSDAYVDDNCEACHTDREAETSADPAQLPYHAMPDHANLACTTCHASTTGVAVDNEDGWSFESAASLRKQVDVTVCINCHIDYPEFP